MKAYWLTTGVATLVAVLGAVLWFTSNHRLGLILILGGLVVGIMGLVMWMVTAAMGDRTKVLKDEDTSRAR